MAVKSITLSEFLTLSSKAPILDVRSPAEYTHAHIPEAISFPLFTDEERKEIGTAYKQVGRQEAVKIGLNYFGPRMLQHIAHAEELLKQKKSRDRTLLIHCWRGGMRSGGMAWLLDLYGFEVYTLKGGYKAYRKRALDILAQPFKFHVLGGYTGSGKTEVLEELRLKGKPVVNLEALASHKGSAFGALGQQAQLSQEMFENSLAEALSRFYHITEDGHFEQPEPIWVENESVRLGMVNLPFPFFLCLQTAPLYFLHIPFEERLQFIVNEYGKFSQEQLVNGILRIRKRLGGLETQNAIHHLLENDMASCFRILLKHYDKQYHKAFEKNERLIFKKLHGKVVNAQQNAALCINTLQDGNI
jgi:tRNA 2-selenouridine synthase